jgi:hypothetical protein
MEASELRIGNNVDLYGRTATIQGQDFVNHYTAGGNKLSRFKPIEMNELWLVRLGFDSSWAKGEFVIGTKSEHEYYTLWYKSKENGFVFFPVQIKHVHQLQNLYYALTGKELTNN